MDLQFSPDLDAAWCYAILAVIAGFSARRQLSKLLDPLVWEALTTFKGWMLYGAYLFIPIGLFWFLDRTGAIHDTSLFAAVIVGVAYDRILAGEINSISIPGATGGMWKPFNAWADRVTASIKQRLFQYDQRFTDRVIQGVVRNPSRMAALEELLRSRLTDPAPMNAELAAIDALAPDPRPSWVLEKRARCLYRYAVSLTDWQYLLKESRITDPFSYYWYVEQWKSKAISLTLAAVIIGLSVYALTRISETSWAARYDAWRFVKPNASEQDRARARNRLIRRLNTTPSQALVLDQLLLELRAPGLPRDRVDSILGLMLETRGSLASSAQLAAPLIDSLRVVGVDSRTRILQSLRFLARLDNLKLSDVLATTWQPTDGDSVNDLEQYIVDLKLAWKPGPAPALAPAPDGK